jgi:hypothetical protein
MIKAVIAIAAVLVIVTSAASAQHRAGDAALGAVSGAVVLGPVGAVAGAFIGYAAGPSIARSWGLDRSRPVRHRRQASRNNARSESAVGAGHSRASTHVEKNERIATSRSEGSRPATAMRPSGKLPPVQTLE